MTAFAAATICTRQQVDRLRRETDPDDVKGRLARTAEVLAQAQRTRDGALIAEAWRLRLMTLLEADELADIYSSLTDLGKWCEESGDPAGQGVLDWFRALWSILDGEVERAEELIAVSVSPQEALGPLTTIRFFQGKYEELEAQYAHLRREDPEEPSHVVMLAWLWAQQGRITAARGGVDAVGAVQKLPRDRDWLFRLSVLADLAVLLDDRPLAEELYQTMRPYSQRVVLLGDGTGCWGSTDRALGVLCSYLGLYDEAVNHFTRKIARSAAAGAHPWLARTQMDLAALMLDLAQGSSSPGPRAEADVDDPLRMAMRNAREGIATARRLDYPVLVAQADRLESRLDSALAAASEGAPSNYAAADRFETDRLSPDMADDAAASSRPGASGHGADSRVDAPLIRVLDGFESYAANGAAVTWTSRKASDLLCLLVAQRGRPLARERAMEYLWPKQNPARLRNRLAVAISTIRRSLDPRSEHDPAAFISTNRETIRLRLDTVTVDAELFLQAAAAALASATPTQTDHPSAVTEQALSDALERYQGEPFEHAPYAEWAAPLREECIAMRIALLHAVLRVSTSPLRRAEAARHILSADPYDEPANSALVDALQILGARGVAKATRERFEASLD